MAIRGQDVACASIDRLAVVSGAILGVPASPWDVAQLIAHGIARGTPVPASVGAVARDLTGTPFVDLALALPRLAREADDEARAAGAAGRAVSWIDRLNVFTESADEQAEGRAVDASMTAEATVRASMREAERLFLGAVARHPALILHVGITDLRAAIARLHGVRGDSSHHAHVRGLDVVWHLTRAWLDGAQRAWGLVPAVDVLEAYALAKLDAREGFPG